MSSRKRRNKRKIAMLVRMDETRGRMNWEIAGVVAYPVTVQNSKRVHYWETCMRSLARALVRKGLKSRLEEAFQAGRSLRRNWRSQK